MTRSPLLVVIAALALVLAAAALVLQFALPSKGDGASSSELNALKAQVAAIKSGGAGLKVGFVSVETAGKVFTTAVSDIAQHVTDKQQEIKDLGSARTAGTIKEDAYQKKLTELNAELLDASVSAYAAVLDRMIASSDFSDLKTELQSVRVQVDTILDTAKNLELMIKGGVTSTTEIQLRMSQVQSANSQIETIVNQAYAVKIQQAAQKVAIARGFDLVLVQKNVVAYYDTGTVTDITDLVKAEIADYL
jgi:Skp family chaperone for outer membrane proteins